MFDMSPLAADLPSEHRRFTVPEFLRMVEVGILADEDHVELIDGEVLTVAPQGPEHRSLKDELHNRLLVAYRNKPIHILNQGPVYVGEFSLPEPDLAVVRGSARDYLRRHPSGTEALLVVELAVSSLSRDRAKAVDYARGGIPVYWLIDLAGHQLDVYSDPEPESGGYRSLTSLRGGEHVALPTIDETWAVSSLFAWTGRSSAADRSDARPCAVHSLPVRARGLV